MVRLEDSVLIGIYRMECVDIEGSVIAYVHQQQQFEQPYSSVLVQHQQNIEQLHFPQQQQQQQQQRIKQFHILSCNTNMMSSSTLQDTISFS
ncbi:hypothetical protein U1Q18_008555, partial [Sarracenia purpurea var. burkii]